MDKLSLRLEPRTITGKKVKNLRKAGTIPASICGKGIQSESFQLDERTFTNVYRRVGRTALIDLQLPSGTSSAFVRQVQRHPVSQRVLHVDFRIVDLRIEMTADVPVATVGQNPIVERGAGVLSLGHTTLSVKGLPADLPQTIEVDISGIADFTSSLYVRDLNLGDNITILTPADDMLVTITASRMAVEEEAITEQEQMGEPELAADNADTGATENAGDDEQA
jgi:large subunit ribosomal protein L25